MTDPGAARLRLDKFLWFARVVKTRSAAQALAEQGRLRLNGRVIDRSHAGVAVGDVLSFAVHGRVRVLRIEALPPRRGSPAEARRLYTELGGGGGGESGLSTRTLPSATQSSEGP